MGDMKNDAIHEAMDVMRNDALRQAMDNDGRDAMYESMDHERRDAMREATNDEKREATHDAMEDRRSGILREPISDHAPEILSENGKHATPEAAHTATTDLASRAIRNACADTLNETPAADDANAVTEESIANIPREKVGGAPGPSTDVTHIGNSRHPNVAATPSIGGERYGRARTRE